MKGPSALLRTSVCIPWIVSLQVAVWVGHIHVCPNKVLSIERKRYICNVLFYCLRRCVDKKTENSFKRIFFHGIHLGQKYAYNGDDYLAIIIVYGWDSNKEYPHSLLLIQVIFSNDYIDRIRAPVWPLNVTMPVVW